MLTPPSAVKCPNFFWMSCDSSASVGLHQPSCDASRLLFSLSNLFKHLRQTEFGVDIQTFETLFADGTRFFLRFQFRELVPCTDSFEAPILRGWSCVSALPSAAAGNS